MRFPPIPIHFYHDFVTYWIRMLQSGYWIIGDFDNKFCLFCRNRTTENTEWVLFIENHERDWNLLYICMIYQICYINVHYLIHKLCAASYINKHIMVILSHIFILIPSWNFKLLPQYLPCPLFVNSPPTSVSQLYYSSRGRLRQWGWRSTVCQTTTLVPSALLSLTSSGRAMNTTSFKLTLICFHRCHRRRRTGAISRRRVKNS